MGILNLTPDSFSDGGELLGHGDVLLARARAMKDAGAAILDLGAVSTRPGSDPVSEETELDRLLPALEQLKSAGLGPLSVDTYRPAVAEAALSLGVEMINDVKGATEPGMVEILQHYRPWVCLMHMRGSPKTMQTGDLRYGDVVGEVASWLGQRVEALGLPREQVLVDPGIGFGKSDEQNLALTKGLGDLRRQTGCEVLYGASRKSLIGRIASVQSPKHRLPGSLALAGAALAAGAKVLRVHDVAETAQYLALVQALGGLLGQET